MDNMNNVNGYSNYEQGYEQTGFDQSNQGQYQGEQFNNQQYQQNTYNQQMNKNRQKLNTSACEFNKNGKLGFNMIVYLVLATLSAMTGYYTVTAIILAMVAIVEKDSNLTKAIATLIATMLVLDLGVSVLQIVLNPIRDGLYNIVSNMTYGVMYKGMDGIYKALGWLLSFANWIRNILVIVLSIKTFKDTVNGTLNTKIFDKYIN